VGPIDRVAHNELGPTRPEGNAMHGAWIVNYSLAADPRHENRRRADEWQRLLARPDAEPLIEDSDPGRRSRLLAPVGLLRRLIARPA
jgi:hypothetical protein